MEWLLPYLERFPTSLCSLATSSTLLTRRKQNLSQVFFTHNQDCVEAEENSPENLLQFVMFLEHELIQALPVVDNIS